MKINITGTDTTRLLWQQPPQQHYQTLLPSTLDHAKRFHYGSIYFHDQINRPKKVFTEFEKPELLLLNFRRKIQQQTKRAHKKSLIIPKITKTLDIKKDHPTAGPLLSRLQKQQEKVQLTMRSDSEPHIPKLQLKDVSSRMNSNSKYFSSSRRLDLGKPYNAFPGPGSYFTDPKADKQLQSIYTQRKRYLETYQI